MGSIKQNLANNILSGGKFDATDLDGTIPNTNINDNSIDNVTSFPAAGSGIPSVASDPPSPSAGDVWYNTTSNAFKYLGATATGSWATGGNLNTGRFYIAGAGTQTSTLAAGGETPPGTVVATTEAYNGSAWTSVTSMNNPRFFTGSAGESNTSALVFGRYDPASGITESWDGTSWTEVGDMNTGRGRFGGTGTKTAALAAGGGPPNDGTTATETWNGSSWTSVTSLNTARGYVNTGGTYTSALTVAGLSPPGTVLGVVESWNGSAWTEVADVATPAGQRSVFGQDNNNILAVGNGLTELWNGSAWTETTDLSNPRGNTGTANSSPAGSNLVFGGSSPNTATEEWTGAGSPVTKTVTTA